MIFDVVIQQACIFLENDTRGAFLEEERNHKILNNYISSQFFRPSSRLITDAVCST